MQPEAPKAVWIYGSSRNLANTPPVPPGTEVWVANAHHIMLRRLSRFSETDEWTRWFNLHSRAHMDHRYSPTVEFYKKQDGSRPLYTQKLWPDLPGCKEFPAKEIQTFFATERGPIRYFTSSVNWMAPFAYLEGFREIHFHGFALVDTKPDGRWEPERKCFFYWVQRLRDLGVTITYPPEVEAIPFETGDPDTYEGPIYGYQTKPEDPPIPLL